MRFNYTSSSPRAVPRPSLFLGGWGLSIEVIGLEMSDLIAVTGIADMGLLGIVECLIRIMWIQSHREYEVILKHRTCIAWILISRIVVGQEPIVFVWIIEPTGSWAGPCCERIVSHLSVIGDKEASISRGVRIVKTLILILVIPGLYWDHLGLLLLLLIGSKQVTINLFRLDLALAHSNPVTYFP